MHFLAIMITTVLTVIHIVVCLFLIVIVLLQHGKGADMGATFGGSSQTVFGTEGPLPLLNKITTGAAVIFMLSSLGLAYLSSNLSRGSVMHAVKPPAAPIEGALEKAPATVPLPEGQTGQSEAVPKQFPGSEQKTQAATPEQKAATTPAPVEKSTPAAETPTPASKAVTPAPKATPAQPAAPQQPEGENKK